MKAKEFLSEPQEYRDAFVSERENRKTLSPVGIIARSLANQARGEVVTFVNDYAHRYWDPHNAYVFDKAFYSHAIEAVGEEIVAVHFASALTVLEQTLVTGEYNLQEHVDITNNYFVGLPMYKIDLSGSSPETQRLGYKQMREMWEVAREDPTLTKFFDTNTDLLPEEMKSYLEKPGLLSVFPGLLAEYLDFADNFVFHFDKATHGEERFTPRQQAVLAKAETDIKLASLATAEKIGKWVESHDLNLRPLG